MRNVTNYLIHFKFLVVIYCFSCLWGLSAPFLGYSIFGLEEIEHILKWDGYGATYAPNALILYFKEVLYFICGVLLYFRLNIGRHILILLIGADLTLAVLMGVVVSSNVDLFVGIINTLLLGGIVFISYFSERSEDFIKRH